MKCPHCSEGIHEHWFGVGQVDRDADHSGIGVTSMTCPQCHRAIVLLTFYETSAGTTYTSGQRIVHPPNAARALSEYVTGEYAEDFREAAAVLPISPKASAALSRRLVQHIIREKAGITKRTLDQEIEALIKADVLPADLAHDLDAVRQGGNFGAHAIKSGSTGEVVNVDAAEAEWLLDLVEELLDFYFVRPAVREQKRAGINKKLEEANKPLLRGTPSEVASGSQEAEGSAFEGQSTQQD